MARKVSTIRKRDGRVVPLEPAKIRNAIWKAFLATGTADKGASDELAQKVVAQLEARFADQVPSVEDVQDIVESTLIAGGYAAVAKAYILYREKRSEIREAKRLLGVSDELKLTVNAVKVLERRYLLRNEEGKVVETPLQLFRRVAHAVAKAESMFDPKADVQGVEEVFFGMLAHREFLPNSPTLMNASTSLGQLSACFVIPVEDSMKSIFTALQDMAIIHQSGGGTGFSFSRLRPKGDIVRSTKGIASGPVSFMKIFDMATEVIKQGGKRRGANMGILGVEHPDVLEFIEAKSREGVLTNFNVSVAVSDRFMEAVQKGKEYPLISPRTGEEIRQLSARHVFDLIVASAWKSGDPGLIFIDEINRHNPTPQVARFESTNPCGELPLLPYESCNLGSINVAKMVMGNDINWDKLREIVRLAVRFLDDVIEVNKFPVLETERMTKGNRKIGLGIMGFADALVLLQVPYNSEEAVAFARKVMKFLLDEAREASVNLAKERGVFPNFPGSVYVPGGPRMRNATVCSVAPTGTISIIAGCSSGIEPIFALSFVRNVMEGARLLEVNPTFEKIARDRGFYSAELMAKLAKDGTLRDIKGIPDDVREVFVTDFDISPEWHVRMQAAFQQYCDNAVSKTINLPPDATVNDVRESYLRAYQLKCKGITVFRYGSKQQQVLYRGGSLDEENGEVVQFTSVDSEYSGGCPEPVCEF